jgi:integrase
MSTSATILDIYNYPRRLELALENLKKNAKISATNRRLILAFHQRSVAEGLSTPRLVRYVHILSKLAEELGKGFSNATREDITRLVAQVENRPLSDWTKQSYKVVLKKFYKWLKHTKGYPKEVDWIRTPSRIRNSILPTDLLNEDDIKRLASAATTPRDRALVLVLYESGCRIGEILSLRIRNVEFDKYGAVLVVTGMSNAHSMGIDQSARYSRRKNTKAWKHGRWQEASCSRKMDEICIDESSVELKHVISSETRKEHPVIFV